MLGDQNREAAVRHLARIEELVDSGPSMDLGLHAQVALAYAMLALVDAQRKEVLW